MLCAAGAGGAAWYRRKRQVAPETARSDSPVADSSGKKYRNAPGHWNWFISHVQDETAVFAEAIYSEFKVQRGLGVWMDVKMDHRDVKSMEEGITNSDKVLILISESYFKSDYCCKELRWARDAQKELVVCIDVKNKKRIAEFLDTAPKDLKRLGEINFIDLNRGDKDYWKVGVKKIMEAETRQMPLWDPLAYAV